MLQLIYEALKTAGIGIIISFAVVAYLLLAGCVSTEGAGFENRGKQSRPACMHRDTRGHEVWRTC
jgi:hypothetical protein